MYVDKLWTKNLHGSIDVDITFFTGINILVGINGSGKTSILNALNSLLSVNIAWLGTNHFDEIGVQTIDPAGSISRIVCTQEWPNMYIHGFFSGEQLTPIHVRMAVQPDRISGDARARLDAEERYRGLGPDEEEKPLWSRLEKISRPLAILLDRTITVQRGSSIYDDFTESRNRSRNDYRLDPIHHVEIIARDRHAKFQSRLIKLNDTLKTRLIASSFETDRPSARYESLTSGQIDRIESKLLGRMSAWTGEPVDMKGVQITFED